jgi:GNAT superfamily N-acetyltransferase
MIITHDDILVREMTDKDCATISEAFIAQGWRRLVEQYALYCQESAEGKRTNLLAEWCGQFAGYVTIVWESDYPPFRDAGIPEIVDFNVLLRFRRQGVGTALMDEAEKQITQRAPAAGLGVCLHTDYGAAQVLYAKRGYVPDGRGVYYHGHSPQYEEQVTIGDDLALYLIKRLR